MSTRSILASIIETIIDTNIPICFLVIYTFLSRIRAINKITSVTSTISREKCLYSDANSPKTPNVT